MSNEVIKVYNKDEFLFDITGARAKYNFIINNEDIEIIEFITSTGIDFLKINTEKSLVGVYAEMGWAKNKYPEFEKVSQSLYFLKFNDRILPCDLILHKNKETGEEKEIWFEVSDFLGSWQSFKPS